MTLKTLEIGTRVKCNGGYVGVVKSNEKKSYYGHCPEGMVIVQLGSGMTVVSVGDCDVCA